MKIDLWLLFALCVAGCGGSVVEVGSDADAAPEGDVCFPALVECFSDGGCRQGTICVPASALDAGVD